MNKFIEFLEAAALIILTGVIVVGVMKYIDTKEEPKEETPIVEELPGDELPEEDNGTDEEPLQPTIRMEYIPVSGPESLGEVKYYDGITWEELIILNDITNFSIDADNEVTFTNYVGSKLILNGTNVSKNDVVQCGVTYDYGC